MKAGILFAVTFALIFLTAIPVRAGKFAGIEPGISTKEDVEAVLGVPLVTVSNGERYEYDGKGYQAKVISIRYSPQDFVVENIDIYPIPETFKAEYQHWFALAAPTSAEKDERGKLVEYYFPQAIVLHYQGPTDVDPVEYFSHVPFEKSEPEKLLERVWAEEPTLTASPSSVRPGDLITLKFNEAPGNAQDWVALYPAGAPGERYGEWYYLEGRTEGELSFTAPEKEGNYEFRLLANWPEGGYEAIATSKVVRVGVGASPERRIEQDSSSLNDGLLAYYPFNGNANDESGNGNDGMVHGASLTNDRFGNDSSAFTFDGMDDYIDTSVGESLPQTVAAWVKPDSFAENDFMTVLDSDKWSYYGQGIEISYPGKNPGHFQVDTHNSFYDTEKSVEWDVWQHVVAVYTSGNVKFYHNGILIHSQDYSQGDLDGKVYTIGNHCRTDLGHFKGVIDDVRIYNRALSGSEIEELYEMGSSPPIRVTVPADLPAPYNDTFRLSSGKLIIGELLSFDGSVFKIRMEAGVIEKKKEEIIVAWLGVAP